MPAERLSGFLTAAMLQPGVVKLVFFLFGALLMLSFAPFSQFYLAPILLMPFLYVSLHLSPKQVAGLGFWFGAGLFLAGTYWMYVSIHVFGNAPVVVAFGLMLGLVIIMGLYYAACGWLISKLCGGNHLRFLLVAPAVWVVVEWIRGWFLSGFPWMSLGYAQIDSPLAGFAPLAGVYSVSLVVAVCACALTLAAMSSGRARVLYLSLAATPWILGLGLQQVSWTSVSGPAVRTTIVQGGVSQDRKWLREQFRDTLILYRDSLAAHPDSKLVVWPEVAIPAVRDQVQEFVDSLHTGLSVNRQVLLFGILERVLETGQIFNSVVSLHGNIANGNIANGNMENTTIEQVYRKRHLVPFGEYFPVPDFVREWMRLMSLPHSDLSAGAATQPLITMPDGNKLAVAICYEDAYGAEQLYALPQASVLINVSNDAWFGDTIAPHQHLEIARMRALESGRPVVRATNNGVSAFIDADGGLIQTGEQFTYVAMTHDVLPRSGQTPYAATGNWPVILLSFALAGAFGYRRMA